MKIRLLNNPGYLGMENVVFPVCVGAEITDGRAWVTYDALVAIGADGDSFFDMPHSFPAESWEAAE